MDGGEVVFLRGLMVKFVERSLSRDEGVLNIYSFFFEPAWNYTRPSSSSVNIANKVFRGSLCSKRQGEMLDIFHDG